MKSAWFKGILFVAVMIPAMFACKKKTTITNPPAVSVAGKGGLATMRVVLVDTGLNVDSGKVYVKYNTFVVPKDNKYDDSCHISYVDGVPMALFTNLKPGNYFFYGRGWSIIRSRTVSGTRPFTIPEAMKDGINYLYLQTSPE
ncbi:MAG: hypothetical protein JST82_07885 [Bacteroidetes bacterium]|nr:hypothetical protein [Bacteroidota bacterium]